MSKEFFLVKRGSTALPNTTVLDPELTFQALGVLTTALAIPPGKPMGYRVFVGMRRGMGEDAVRKALNLLTDLGYRHQFKARVKGQYRTLTVISDERISENDALTEIETRGGYDVIIPNSPKPGFNSTTPESSKPAKKPVSAQTKGVCAGQTMPGFPRRGENHSNTGDENEMLV